MLCKELGPVPELQEQGEDGEGQPPRGSLLADVRQLLLDARGKEEGSAALHGAVNSLMAAVQEDLRRNSEARDTLSMWRLGSVNVSPSKHVISDRVSCRAHGPPETRPGADVAFAWDW